ncbi:hypothetical protein PV327_005036 [Microctonus hyperodae]|uniref:Mutator-like transposase domain-containing protein n=1 Tax=Microctonus hyperodae TaxID=165561 RepID=A0AA39G0Y9_MICHY|nr:hypothetical protein PV327_005036 [Microctonus hyperodae]
MSLIGEECKKIISYATRSKACAKCRVSNPKSTHNCRQNYSGSSKSMEPDMGIALIVKNPLLDNENFAVGVLIGGDDSSTIAAPFFKQKINTAIVNYLGYCFTCAIKTNKNDVQGVQNALRNITPHVFGDHGQCGEWCQYRGITGDYVHHKLPGSKPLSDPKLRALLSNTVEKYVNVAEKLPHVPLFRVMKNTGVKTKTAKAAHLDVIAYLKKCSGKVILVAHNGFRFDALKILKASNKLGVIGEFLDIVIGFAHSLVFENELVYKVERWRHPSDGKVH